MLLKFSHSFSLFFLFALFPASYAHALVSPPLGVKGTPQRSDVERPSNSQPCGKGVNIASLLDTSTAVPADAAGNVKVAAINFNPGADGSRKVTAKVDPSGTGKNFLAMTVSVNGDPAPKNTGSQDVVAQLPTGTKCAGGSDKSKCLVQFVTTKGFGNCVVVSQAGNVAPTPTNARVTNFDGVVVSDRAVEDAAASETKKKKGKQADKKKKDEKKKDKKGNKKKDKVAAVSKSVKGGDDKGDIGMKKKAGGQKKGGKVAAKKSGGEKKKGAGKKKEKKGSNKKQAGTRAARALLAEFERDARAADVVRDLGVDDVE